MFYDISKMFNITKRISKMPTSKLITSRILISHENQAKTITLMFCSHKVQLIGNHKYCIGLTY